LRLYPDAKFQDYASELKASTLDLLVKTGLWEYFDATDGSGHGTDAFSWTSSLLVDLVNERD